MPDAKDQQAQMSEQDAANAKDPNHPAHPSHPHVCIPTAFLPTRTSIKCANGTITARRMGQECWKEVRQRRHLWSWSDGWCGCCEGGFGTVRDGYNGGGF